MLAGGLVWWWAKITWKFRDASAWYLPWNEGKSGRGLNTDRGIRSKGTEDGRWQKEIG